MTTFFTYFSKGYNSDKMADVKDAMYSTFDVVDEYDFDGIPVFAIQSDETNEMVFAGTFRDLVNSVGNNNGMVYLTPINLYNERNLSWLSMNQKAMDVREFLLLIM